MLCWVCAKSNVLHSDQKVPSWFRQTTKLFATWLQNLCRVFFFCIPQTGLKVGFFEEWLPSCHPTIQARFVECLGYCCHMQTVTSLCHKGISLLRSCHWPLGGLSHQSPPCLVIQFGGMAWSRLGLGGTECLSLVNDCLDCAPRDIQGLWNILYPSPDVCLSTTLSRRSFESPLCSWLSLCCEMHYSAEETFRNSWFYSEIIRITTNLTQVEAN